MPAESTVKVRLIGLCAILMGPILAHGLAVDVAVGSLFEEGVEAQKGEVAGTLGQLLCVFLGLDELRVDVCHGDLPWMRVEWVELGQ